MWKRQQPPPEWTEQFTLVVRTATGDESLDFFAAAARLQSCDCDLLLKFDLATRRLWWHSGVEPFDRARITLRQALKEEKFSDLLLFLEACNSNGHVREKALRALRGHPGRLTPAATLLRADDWVPQVATLAENMLVDIAVTDRARYLFEFLELIIALRRRSRFGRIWPGIERALRAPQWRSERQAAAMSTRGAVRRFALELTVEADPDLAASSLISAATDISPLVSVWALATASRMLAPAEYLEVVHRGLTNPMSFVRSDAMRRFLRGGFDGANDLLRRLALDPAHAVRATAAHYLRQDHGEKALSLWRSTLDAGRMVDAMTLSLADEGDKTDMDRLRPRLGAARARTRAAALRGLWRLGAPDIAALLAQALHDNAALVVAAAARIYRKSTETLDRATLESALSQAERPGLKTSLLSAARLLRKWDRLAFLLDRSLQWPGDSPALEREIGLWLQTANRSYTMPSPAQTAGLRASIDRLRLARPSHQLDLVAFHL